MDRRNFIAAVGGALAYTHAVPSLAQYVIPDGQVRLVFNENPYGPSPKALAAVKDILSLSAYYPDSPTDYPIRDDLFDAISSKHQLTHDNLFVSSGSNEGLQAALMAYGKDGAVLTPALTYNDHLGYAERWASQSFGCHYAMIYKLISMPWRRVSMRALASYTSQTPITPQACQSMRMNCAHSAKKWGPKRW